MRLWLERWAPVIVAGAGLWVWWWLNLSLPLNAETMLSAALTLGSILTGFLATAKAILVSLKGTEVMKSLAESGFLEDVFAYMAWGIWTAFAFAVLCLVGFFGVSASPVYAGAWIFVGLLAGTAFLRVTIILLKIVRYSHQDD